jgi:hypothetical protein
MQSRVNGAMGAGTATHLPGFMKQAVGAAWPQETCSFSKVGAGPLTVAPPYVQEPFSSIIAPMKYEPPRLVRSTHVFALPVTVVVEVALPLQSVDVYCETVEVHLAPTLVPAPQLHVVAPTVAP